MKKIAILTSILALAACGGGSGSGGGAGSAPISPDAPIVDDNGTTTEQQELQDFIADMSGTEPMTFHDVYDDGDEQVVFDIKDGEIREITFSGEYYGGDSETYKKADATGWYYYYNTGINFETDYFASVFEGTPMPTKMWFGEVLLMTLDDIKEFFKDADNVQCNSCTDEQVAALQEKVANMTQEDLDSGAMIIYHEAIKPITFGKRAGLKYSNFGLMEFGETRNGQIIPDGYFNSKSFLGGYESKLVEKPTKDTVFTGVAAAAVNAYIESEDRCNYMLSVIDDATLKVVGGKEELTANFSKAETPWYDVKIKDGEFEFSNEGAIKNDDFKFNDKMIERGVFVDAHITKYYGENNQPTEVVSKTNVFGIDEDNYNELDSSIVFGGTAK